MKIKHLFTGFGTWLVLMMVLGTTAAVAAPPSDAPAVDPSAVSPGPSVAGSEGVAPANVVQPISTSDDQPLSDKLRKRRLYWAEPVTGTGKNVPQVSSDEIKLLAVHGTVSVTTPDGQTKAGTNGMLVPSGSTVSTSTGASAAVLMGGVNSARLVPNSDVSVSQNMQGTVRHTMLDLKDGAVFSRVGREAGSSQDYEVRTPEGVAAARGTELLDGRIRITVDGKNHWIHVVYVNKGTVALLSLDGKQIGVLKGGAGDIGMGSMGSIKLSREELEKYLDLFLKEIQAFNVTTIKAILDYESGDPTAEDLAIIEGQLYGSVPDGGDNGAELTQDDQIFLATAAASFQDLVPNEKTNALGNPLDAPTSSAELRGR